MNSKFWPCASQFVFSLFLRKTMRRTGFFVSDNASAERDELGIFFSSTSTGVKSSCVYPISW